MASTCNWSKHIIDDHPMKINSGAFLLTIITDEGLFYYMSKYLHVEARRYFPVSDLNQQRCLKLRGFKIDLPTRMYYPELRTEKILKACEAVTKAKIFYDTLHLKNCLMEEIVEALKALMPKRAVLWMKSVDKWKLNFWTNTVDHDGEVDKIFWVPESVLPPELMIVSKSFKYLRKNFLFPLIRNTKVFQAVALGHYDFYRRYNTSFLFIQPFVDGDSMGKNEILMFIYRNIGRKFNLQRFPTQNCRINFDQESQSGHITRLTDGTRLHVEARHFKKFSTVTFAIHKKNEDFEAELKKKINYLHDDLDETFTQN